VACQYRGCPQATDRPVVVIDPEDREQVERLARDNYDLIHKPGAFDALSQMSQDAYVEFMQAALRSLIAPPKPPEPQGLGAVVEDAEGRRWVRVNALIPWQYEKGDTRVSWTAVAPAPVRVLSEGVKP
jgi:hypothetical protein